MKLVRGLGSSLAALLTLGVLAGAAGSAPKPNFSVTPLTPDSTYQGVKSVSGELAQTDPTLLGRSDSTPVNVMIKYDVDGAASYTGGVAGLAPTSPAVTGKPLDDNKAAVSAYVQHADKVSDGITKAVESAVPGADVRTTFTTAYGGVSATVPANRIGDLLKVSGVAAVQEDSLAQPQDDNTGFIGATAVWPSLGGSSHAGSNVIVGLIDSGVWPEHPMLSPAGIGPPAGGLRGCSDFATGGDVAHLGPAFTCNNKLIGAHAETATYMAVHGSDGHEFCNDTTDVCSPRDSEGHGTHTLTTAVGDCVSSAVLYGTDRGPVCGIAPGAHVIVYRVCLSAGCFASDSVAAVQQAILDGVNVINFSLSGGASPYTDPVELAFLDAFNAGISVNAAAGNDGPDAGTSDHGGPWVTTVGASSGPRSFSSTLHLTSASGATLDVPGVTITGGLAPATPVVLAQDIPGEDELCSATLSAGSAATGKVVLCERGGTIDGAPIGRVDKGFNVFSGGAAGMVLYNPVAQDVETDNHWLPAIQVDGPPTALLAFVSGQKNVKATWAQGVATPSTPDVMAPFSSRGPVGDFLKPDITAPGIQVLAGMTPEPDETTPTNGPPGNLFAAMAGTSMSTPHATGVSTLVKAAHPDWTPAEIKSALMTSSVQDVVEQDGTTPATPFDDGAGSIRADRAVDPTLVFDETYADYVASATNPLHRIDLNLASVDAPTMSGLIRTKRSAINVTGKDQDLAVTTVAPPGVQIIVSDKAPKRPGPDGKPAPLPRPSDRIHLKKNGTTDFWITISAPDLGDGQYFGQITLDPRKNGNNPVTIPVAFTRTQGNVSLTNTCSPTSFSARNGSSHCTVTAQNLGSLTANASITVTQREKGKALSYRNIGAPGSPLGPGRAADDGVRWSGSLSPAIAPPVNGITLGGGQPFGYVPLSALGVGPVLGFGDDTIADFGLPAPVLYGAEAYTSIGVVSNGYVVLGGGDAGDIVFPLQHFPDPARPNNVIAPLWTDLNPSVTGAGNIYLADLSLGDMRWSVIDWEGVKNAGNATTHSFEIWLATADSSTGEQITIAYGPDANAGSGDPGSGQNWGAENRDGSSGANIPSPPANDSQYSVDLSPPIPGGSVTIPFDLSSKKPGTYHSDASMTSDQTPGTTIAPQTLTVTP